MRAANDNRKDRYRMRQSRGRGPWYVLEITEGDQDNHAFTNPRTGKLSFTEKDARAFLSTLRAAAHNIRLA